MPEDRSPLLVGPLLRYVDSTSALVWVEVAARGVVTVTAADRHYRAHTFTVHGHHYALVDVTDLRPGQATPYSVSVDGTTVWPLPGSAEPPSRIRTISDDDRLRIAFGSCRTTAPHDAKANRIHGPDVLHVLARQLAGTSPDDSSWPSLLLLLGDQVYADMTSAPMRDYIAGRRDIEQPPGPELLDYDEYAYLYRLAWADPDCRWLLSTVPSAMIFDDHDIRDDWNTSIAWRQEMQRVPWWHRRIVSGLASYWVYQHIGNLAPSERRADSVWRDVMAVGRDGDAGDVLDDMAAAVDADPGTYRWSFHRDVGNSRLLMVDTRAARMLDESGRRMLDPAEWDWLDGLLTGDVDHLLIATSLPYLLPMGLHHLEAWNEALVGGAWGRRAARLAEWFRQAVDLEHWAAFQHSFRDLARCVLEVATGQRGAAPASVLFLSGDVHHSYLADVRLDSNVSTRILQAVCSPIRNPLPRWIRWVSAASVHGMAGPAGVLAARTTRLPAPPFRWSITDGPWYDNAIATLDIDGRHADLRWETAELDRSGSEAMRHLRSARVT